MKSVYIRVSGICIFPFVFMSADPLPPPLAGPRRIAKSKSCLLSGSPHKGTGKQSDSRISMSTRIATAMEPVWHGLVRV